MMSKSRRLIVAVAVAAALAFAGLATWLAHPAAPAVTFITLQGDKITSDSLRGKVVLVNFWATDCAVCVREMPAIAATHLRYRERGFETIAVAMRHDPPNYVIHFTEKNALPFKVALDPMGELARAFGEVKFTPTTFVIDRRGRLVARILGEPDFVKLQALIEQKLGET